MKSLKVFIYAFILLCSFSLSNCTKSESIPADLEVNDFVWKGLNTYYFWQDQIPDLSDIRFSSQSQLNNFLSTHDTPNSLFFSLLYNYPTIDKYSWIVSDYVALENSFQGINQSNGMEFGLVRYMSTSSNLFGYVRYVLTGSDAAMDGITRGMLFNQVNGQQLTETNYRNLLFSNATSYTITLADYNSGNPTATSTTIMLTKSELQENPVNTVKTFTEGSNKIGYLMYNQFVTVFDGALNTAFATLKSEGVTDLIVDLRYNPGGSVRTATYLGQMITGQFSGQLFSREVWNSKVRANISAGNFENNFTAQINNGIITENINSLNLSRVYFIVTGSSASASELLINSLRSYIDVRLIGTATEGKNVGSITLYDSENYRRSGANPNHTWAMQPIVLEIQNRDGTTAPGGFTPEIVLAEDYSNLGVLGERGEPLLDRAISYILTGARFSNQLTTPNMEEISHSKLFTPTGNNMYTCLKK
ncbi:MAG: peptidase S41 [Flavobacteriaceae bacterium]|nr:MAG: peptidase S41 [Flavobacteriaceae bacterium]